MISLPQIPAALRYPGAYIAIDGSQAGLGGDIPAVLLVGQKLATGTAPAGEIVRLSGVKDAEAKAGIGSMLAQMAARYRKIDPALDLYMLPYADNVAGGMAAAPITVTAAAVAAVATLTARHKGTCGNGIDIRLNLYGEAMPAGLALTLTAMSGGAGDPLPGDLTATLGQRW